VTIPYLTPHRAADQAPEPDVERLHGHLQVIGQHLVDLHIHGRQAHNVAFGVCRPEVQLWLGGIAQTARAASAIVEERVRTLDAPSVRRTTSTSTTAIPPGLPGEESSIAATVDMISRHTFAVVDAIRAVLDRIGAVDVSTADLLRAITDTLEKQAWLLHSTTTKPKEA
jgi:starvation-inducible DNA-binding protein